MSSNHWRPGTRAREANFQKLSVAIDSRVRVLSKRAAARGILRRLGDAGRERCGGSVRVLASADDQPQNARICQYNSNSSAHLDKEGLPFRTPFSHLQPLPRASAFGATQQPYHGLLPPSVPRAARGGAVAGGIRRRANRPERSMLRLNVGRHVHRMLLSLGRAVRDGNRRGILRRRKFHLVRLQPLQLVQWVLQGRDVRHNSQRPKQLLLLERHMVRR